MTSTRKPIARPIQTALQASASLTVTAWGRRLSTPRSSTSIATMTMPKIAHNIGSARLGPDQPLGAERLGRTGVELPFPACHDHRRQAVADQVDRGARHVHQLVHTEDDRHRL